jgi:hypothetical protein
MISGHRQGELGHASLACALLVLVIAGLVAGGVADLARSELVITRHRRTLAAGLAGVDACLAEIVGALPAGWAYDALLRGPDGLAGTIDDGIVPAPPRCRGTLAPGPLGATRPYLDVTVTLEGGGRRLRALLGHAAEPAPSPLWVADPGVLGPMAGSLVLDGRDPLRPDLPPLPAVVGPADAGALDAWIAATTTTVAPGTPAAAFHPPPPLADLAPRLAAVGASPVFAPAPSLPPPGYHLVAGDLVVATPGFGAGFLYVDGRLDITADFAFSGIVVARGGLRLDGGSTLTVDGSLWIGAAPFDLAGDALLRHQRAAVDAIDAIVPLPRRPVVRGVVDS